MYKKIIYKKITVISLVVLISGCGKKSPQELALEPKSVGEFKNRISKAEAPGLKRAYLEKMIEKYPEDQDISTYRLSLADIYFEDGKKNCDNGLLETAHDLYRKFYKLNPGDKNAEYARFRAILSVFHQADNIENDTTQYQTAIKKCNKYLSLINNGIKGKFELDVKDVLYTCERKLIDKDIYVFNSYVKQGKLESAQKRIDGLKKEFLSKHPDLEPKIKYLECKLACYKNDMENAKEISDSLKEIYPESHYAKLAQDRIDKTQNNIFTF